MAYRTEREKIAQFELYTIEIEKMLITSGITNDVLNQVPYMAHICEPKTYKLITTNNVHELKTGISENEIKESWEDYIDIFHPSTFPSLRTFLPQFYAQKQKNNTISFLQYAKILGEQDYRPILTFSKVSGLPRNEKLWIFTEIEELGNNLIGLDRIIQMDEFKLKHFRRFQSLTGREVDILRFLALGFNNPKIAENLSLARSTVETHRKNLKRKLCLKSYRDVMRYALAFSLIRV